MYSFCLLLYFKKNVTKLLKNFGSSRAPSNNVSDWLNLNFLICITMGHFERNTKLQPRTSMSVFLCFAGTHTNTHTHTNQKWIAKVAKVAKVASMDLSYTETHTHTHEKWVAKVAKVANMDLSYTETHTPMKSG